MKFEKVSTSDLNSDEIYKETQFSILKGNYNLANMLGNDNYHMLISNIEIVKSSLMAMFVAAIDSNTEHEKIKKSVQSMINQLYTMSDGIIETNKNREKMQ